jgi:hypothetical protein
LKHHDTAVAVNYWFSGNLVIKTEYHWAKHNYFAAPENPLEALLAGTLRDDTTLFQIGVQFSF